MKTQHIHCEAYGYCVCTNAGKWKLFPGLYDGQYKIGTVKPMGKNEYCSYAIVGSRKDAEFVLKRINNHDDLLEIAKIFKDVLESYGGTIQGSAKLYEHVKNTLSPYIGEKHI